MIPRMPLLAATIESEDDLANLQFPLWVSKKYDGIRAITTGSGVVSRTLKPIPNRHINSLLSDLPAGIEGELCRITMSGQLCHFEDTDSSVMTEEGKPLFRFFAFDWFGETRFCPYVKRYAAIGPAIIHNQNCITVKQAIAKNPEQVQAWFEAEVELNHGEGIMIRDPMGFYKFGRSTLQEQLLIKYKPWNTDEAVVLDVLEEFENQNEKLKDERGLSKRSKHSVNLKGKGTMGALLVKSKKFGEFKIGSGFTDEMAQEIWNRRKNKQFELKAVGVQYRYRDVSKYNKPKHTSFLKWL